MLKLQPGQALAARVSLLTVTGLLASGVVGFAAISPAAAVDCTSGTITTTSECTIPGTAGIASNYNVTVIGGGGGGVGYSSGSPGGGGAIVTTTVSLVGGSTIKAWVGGGGLSDNGTASGGGSSALTAGSSLLVEAGGGGGASYASSGSGGWAGGDAGLAGGAGETPDGDDWGTCTNDLTGGRGASGTGAGGAGGTGVCDDGGFDGGAGMASVGGAAAAGGDGATVGGVGGGLSGAAGYSPGGDSGTITDDYSYVGSGGGGGYGGGGGGATNDDGDENGPGGGGGSYTNPAFTSSTSYATASPGPGGGGEGDIGTAGQITLTVAPGPQVQTQAAAPAVNNSALSATVHSMVNANGADTSAISIRYSTSPTLEGATDAAISPSAATGSSDTAITGTLTGLTASTTYYYQVVATNTDGTTYGAIESFAVGAAPAPPNPVALSVLSLPDQVVAGRQTPVTIRVTIDGQPVDGVAKVYHASEEKVAARLGGFVCEAQIVNGDGVCFGVFGLGKIKLISLFDGSGATGVVSNRDNAVMAAASIKPSKPKNGTVRLRGLTMKNNSALRIYKTSSRSVPATFVKSVRSGSRGAWAAKASFSSPSTIYCAVTPQGRSKSIRVTTSGFSVLSARSLNTRGDAFFC